MTLGNVHVLVATEDIAESTTPVASWISDAQSINESTSAICVYLDILMPGSYKAQVLSQSADGWVTNYTFLLVPPNSPRINGVFEVALLKDAVVYNVAIFCGIPDLSAGQDAGFIRTIDIVDGSCVANGKLSRKVRKAVSL